MQITSWSSYELGVVGKPDHAVPEVHGLLGHDVDADHLLLRLAQEAMLASDEAEDRVGLRNLEASYKSNRN